MAREPIYGFFHGGDPREFTPDGECCTPEEIARHKADCELWENGQPNTVPVSGFEHDAAGNVMHVCRSAYGLGTYYVDFDDDGQGVEDEE